MGADPLAAAFRLGAYSRKTYRLWPRRARDLRIVAAARGVSEDSVLRSVARDVAPMVYAERGLTVEDMERKTKLMGAAVKGIWSATDRAIYREARLAERTKSLDEPLNPDAPLEDQVTLRDIITAPPDRMPLDVRAVFRRLLYEPAGHTVPIKDYKTGAVKQTAITGLLEAAGLAPKESEALWLRVYKGHTESEAADASGVSLAAHKSSYGRAISKLRKAADTLGLDRCFIDLVRHFTDTCNRK
jgi:DNA-directed RNA polymerase specialized sigma24 family protein